MPTFNDSENMVQLVPEGDYRFKVVQFDEGISSGAKTAGSTMFKSKLQIELSKPGEQGPTLFENFIDHSATAWRIDTFLKSCGVKIPKGAAFEFDRETAIRKKALHVNPYGLRGWCRLVVEDYKPSNSTQTKQKNKVAAFYTDKEKLPRDASIAAPAPVPFSTPETGPGEEDIPF